MSSSTLHQGLARWRRALRHRHNWTELARFCVVGASGYAVNLAVYVPLVQGAGAHYLVAAAASFCVAVSSNFIWNRLWTFRHRRGPVARQGARFLVVSLGALALNLVVLRATVALGAARIPAQALAIVLATPVSFLGNRLWSFRAPPASVDPGDRRWAQLVCGCAALLGATVVVWDFVLPQAPARLAKPSAELIGHLPLWSSIAGWHLPVPATRTELLVVVVVSTALGFAAYAAAVRACWGREATRARLLAVAGVAVALFALTAIALPTLNTDVYEYIATGRIAAHHHANPYAVAANRFPGDPVYRYTDRQYTAIPGDNKLAGWTLLDAALARVAGHDVVTSLLAYRVVLLLCGAISLLLIARLLRELHPRAQLAGVVAYGWNPVVIVGAPTKVDSVMVMVLLAGTLALVRGHRRLAAVGLTLSAVVKLITLPLVAVHWLGEVRSRRWRAVAVDSALMAATVAAVYAPFAGAPGLVSRELGLLRTGGSSPARFVAGVAFAGLVAYVGWRQDGTPRRLLRGWAVVSLAFAALLPDPGFSWYLMVAVAVVAVAASAPLLAAMIVVTSASFAINLWHGVSGGPLPVPSVAGAGGALLAAMLVAVALVAIRLRRRVAGRAAPPPPPPSSSGASPGLVPALAGAPALAAPRLTPAAVVGYTALAAMLAVSAILGAGAAAGASFLVPSVQPVLPGWVAGALAGLGPIFSRGGLLIVLFVLTAAYALALAVRRSLPARAVIGAIVALHLVFLLAPPLLSSDIFSYVAYGRLGTVHDLSPYLNGPAAAPDDPVLNYVGWRWTYTPSAYGPLFTIGSYGLAGLGTGAALWGFKALAAIASLAVVALVSRTAQARGRDPVMAAAVVGLNPILLVYAVGGGHNDLLMLALTMLGVLLACSARESAGAASVVAAAAVKASSIVVLPFMVLGAPRRGPALLGGLAGAAAFSILGVAVFGDAAFGFVSVLVHSHVMTSTSPASDLTALLGPVPHLRAIGVAALTLALIGLLRAVWRGMDWIAGAGWALLLVAATSGSLHGWYTIWPLPFAALSRDRRLLAATLFLQAIFVAHLIPEAVA